MAAGIGKGHIFASQAQIELAKIALNFGWMANFG